MNKSSKLVRLAIIVIVLFTSCISKSLYLVNDDFNMVSFGNQNGEPIHWYIIKEDREHKVLMSEKVLDVKLYNNIDEKTAWKQTSLYEYLNTDFIDEYFSKDEKNTLIFISNTEDTMVTLPSINNIIDLYGDINYLIDGYYNNKKFFKPNKKIIAKPTDVALNNDIYPYNNNDYADIMQTKKDGRYDFANGSVPYWLIDQDNDGKVYCVNEVGYISIIEPTASYIGIRPIIRIKNEKF